MSEERNKNADYTAEFLDRIHAPEVLDSPDNRKEFIENLDYDSFADWLKRINGMSRGQKVGERSIDGELVEVMTLMPPEPEDKIPLLNATLDAAKQILEENQDTQVALDRVSILFSGSINYIHLFGDGN